jgi:hypothetical protein
MIKVDAANDLALLKAEGKFAALPVATSRAMKLGGTVATSPMRRHLVGCGTPKSRTQQDTRSFVVGHVAQSASAAQGGENDLTKRSSQTLTGEKICTWQQLQPVNPQHGVLSPAVTELILVRFKSSMLRAVILTF